jgi:taurine dehydrogenase small subunit
LDTESMLTVLGQHTDAWNRHDLDALMALFTQDCVFESSGGDEVCGHRYTGHEQVRAAFAQVLESMVDARWGDGRHFVLGPGYGVSEWTLTGTLTDGRRIETNGCDFLTITDAGITRKNSYRKQRQPVE